MLISNSQVNTFQSCQRKHYYAFRERLAPGNHGKALTRGIVGHEALEHYYKAKQKGLPKRKCQLAGRDIIDGSLLDYPDFASDLLKLIDVYDRYVEYFWDEPWKVLEVERQYEMLLDNKTEYGMRLDLLVECTSGADKGQVIIVDHKFVYDFYTDRELQMSGQLIKYMKTLRHNGIPVRKGVINQIRYRQLKNPIPSMLFRRDSVVSSDIEQYEVMEQHRRVAQHIMSLQELTPEEHLQQTTMHIDKYSCGSCAFQPLCKLTLEGNPTGPTKKLLYGTNSYLEQYERA